MGGEWGDGDTTQFSLSSWSLGEWPCSSEYMGNTNWTLSGEVTRVRRQTQEDWEVSVVGVFYVKFPNNQAPHMIEHIIDKLDMVHQGKTRVESTMWNRL